MDKDFFDISDKTVLMTGAQGFIGFEVAKELIKCCKKLVFITTDQRLNERGKELVRLGACWPGDVFPSEESHLYTNNSFKEFDVNSIINMGYNISRSTGFNCAIEGRSIRDWQLSFSCGIYGPVSIFEHAKHFGFCKEGNTIINISSMYASVAPDPALYEGTKYMNPPCYGASKAALEAWTRYIASFYGHTGLRANTIELGPIPNLGGDTPNAVEKEEEFVKRLEAKTCLGIVGVPRDVIGAIIYLISDASSFMTGQKMVIDGGWTVR